MVIIASSELSSSAFHFNMAKWFHRALSSLSFSDEKAQRNILLGAVLETSNISETNTWLPNFPFNALNYYFTLEIKTWLISFFIIPIA